MTAALPGAVEPTTPVGSPSSATPYRSGDDVILGRTASIRDKSRRSLTLSWRPQTRPSVQEIPPQTGKRAWESSKSPEEIRLYEFRGEEGCVVHRSFSVDELLRKPEGTEKFRWLDIPDLNKDTLNRIADRFGLHRMAFEDALQVPQRAKIEWYKVNDSQPALLAIVATMMNDAQETGLVSEQVSMFLIEKTLITVQEGKPGDPFDLVRKRLCEGDSEFRKGDIGLLLYHLVDAMFQKSKRIADMISESLEDLELHIMDDSRLPDTYLHKLFSNLIGNDRASFIHALERIYLLKRSLIMMRKCMLPLCDVIATLVYKQVPTSILRNDTLVCFRVLHGNLLNLCDSIESYKELATTVSQLLHGKQDSKRNKVMYILTLVSSVFLPLTFVAGVYGMNFEDMPELQWEYGYLYAWLFFLSIAIGLIIVFRINRWF